MWQVFAYAGMAGLEMYGGMLKAEAMENQAELQLKVGELSTKYAELDAFEAERFGYTQAARYMGSVDKVIATQKATLISQDIDVNFGTAKAVVEESKFNAFLNSLDIINQGAAQASNIKRQASTSKLQIALNYSGQIFNAQATQTASTISAINTGVSGYAQFASSKAS